MNVDALSSKFEFNIEISDFGKTCGSRIYYNLKWDGSVYNNITKYQQLRSWFREFPSPNPKRIIELPLSYSFTYIDYTQDTFNQADHHTFYKLAQAIFSKVTNESLERIGKYVLRSKVLDAFIWDINLPHYRNQNQFGKITLTSIIVTKSFKKRKEENLMNALTVVVSRWNMEWQNLIVCTSYTLSLWEWKIRMKRNSVWEC